MGDNSICNASELHYLTGRHHNLDLKEVVVRKQV
jgi:hypothetical protein